MNDIALCTAICLGALAASWSLWLIVWSIHRMADWLADRVLDHLGIL